ncbi:hypothetical protein K501DRAFT_332637 [Backusella circina FSU 941]|nr:hypothetical protein K501DRAFT_332637 [Backusella circina FSU 941]
MACHSSRVFGLFIWSVMKESRHTSLVTFCDTHLHLGFFQNPGRTRTEKDLKILRSVDLLGLPAVYSVCNERPWTQKSGYVLRLPLGYRGRHVLGSWGSLIFGFYGTSGNIRNERSYYAQVLNKGVLGEYLTTWIGLRLRGFFLVSNRG